MTWESIIQEVRDFKKNNKNTWFRGQSDPTWELKSSLFRQKFKNLNQFRANERTRYNLFKNLGHIHHKESDWNLVYIMQHHGVKTRLLDWTESFATALFFAANNWTNNSPLTIWMLNPIELNFKTLEKHVFYRTNDRSYEDLIVSSSTNGFKDNSVALHPLRNNQRIVAQQGVFTIQGNTLDSLDNEFNGDLITEGILKRINIDVKLKEDVSSFLDLAGMHPFSIYPDLEGLAKYINIRTDLK
ncbi:FRG domain-containing protein [Paenibacillus sp. NPDC058910]|uniref:FRG domain-containing protein n=1 Tax=unclassified Paenibacillus TaxID=185978 RepID=UPI00369967DB